MIGCACSDRQLALVGCECVETTVTYWPLGYADANGTKTVIMAHGADFEAELVKVAGFTAKFISARPHNYPVPVAAFPAEYVREMSVGG